MALLIFSFLISVFRVSIFKAFHNSKTKWIFSCPNGFVEEGRQILTGGPLNLGLQWTNSGPARRPSQERKPQFITRPRSWLPLEKTDAVFLSHYVASLGRHHQRLEILLLFSSVQFSCSVVSNSLWPHESQHARPPCPSPTPEVHSDSCPSSRWCHPAISSSVIPFSSCPQSLPVSESFPITLLMRWPKYWSFSFSIIPSKEHPGLILFRMDWLNLLAVQGTLKSRLY